MKKYRLFIIVVNYNGGDSIVKLISDIYKISRNYKRLTIETIIVDNESSDGSVQKLRTQNQELRTIIIENKENLGFAAGCNVGIKYALKKGADSILLLNQDVIVNDKFFELLINNQADIVSPVIKFKRDDKWVYDWGGRVNWWLGRTYHLESFNIPITQLSNNPINGKINNNLKYPIDYISGCCILIKREVFEKIGLFNEKYFMYFEDVDFCLRTKKAGFNVAVEPRAIIIHNLLEGKKKPMVQYFHHFVSNLKFINSWISLYNRPFAYIYLLFLLFRIFLTRLL